MDNDVNNINNNDVNQEQGVVQVAACNQHEASLALRSREKTQCTDCVVSPAGSSSTDIYDRVRPLQEGVG